MTSLITRLREAKEGSRELDAEIHAALFLDDAMRLIEPHPQIGPRYYVRDSSHMPAYTTDLSAAVALCEWVLGIDWKRVITNRGYINGVYQGPMALLYSPWSSGPVTARGVAATEPLALCLALLTAKEKANQ